MFQSHPTWGNALRPAHVRRAGRFTRKLGIEVMESRLMLSITTAEQPLELHSTPIILDYSTVRPASITTFEAAPADGGFIAGNVLTMTTDSYAWAEMGQQLYAGGVASQNLIDNLQPLATHWLGGVVNSIDFTDGLQPAVIPMSGEGTGLEPNIKPIIAGPPQSKPGLDGGAIPIHALLSDLRREDHLAAGATLRSSSASSAFRAAASGTSLSGEWARAVVFEIAGGEPGDRAANDTYEEHPAHENAHRLQHEEPLSGNDLQPADGQAASSGAGHITTTKEQLATATGQGSGQTATSQSAAIDQVLADAQRQPGMPHPPNAGSATPSNTPPERTTASIGSDKAETAALATVFDELGQGSATIVESSVRRGSWSRWLSASPLLMILALERIAAVNSRRAARAQHRAIEQQPRRESRHALNRQQQR